MIKKYLKVYVKEVFVYTNGDSLNDLQGTEEAKNNVIIGTLKYPHSGSPVVTSSIPCNLVGGENTLFDSKNFWKAGLFKEKIEDETVLKIQITDKDSYSNVEKLILKALGVTLTAGLGAALGLGSVPVLGAISNFAFDEYKKILQPEQDGKVKVIAECEMKIQNLDTMESGSFAMPLITGDNFSYGELIPDTSGSGFHIRKHSIEKGKQNGKIVLQIEVEDIP